MCAVIAGVGSSGLALKAWGLENAGCTRAQTSLRAGSGDLLGQDKRGPGFRV